MSKKLSGWQRLWILISIIYLFVVVGFTILLYQPPPRAEYKKIRYTKTVELINKYVEGKLIDEMMIELKKYLINREKDVFDEAALKHNFDIDIKESKDKYIVTAKDGKRFAFPKKTSPDTIVNELSNYLRRNIKPAKWDVIAEAYVDWSDEELISRIHQKYADSLDFSSIESEYKENELKYEKDKKIFIFKYVAYTFAFWIVPIILAYFLGLSIGWVAKGFRKK